LVKNSKPDYKKNLKIFEELLKEATCLKVFPPANPLEGIEVDIRITKILNSVKQYFSENPLVSIFI
jgi:hypothetical protein